MAVLLAFCLKDNRTSIRRMVRIGLFGLVALAIGLGLVKLLPALPPSPIPRCWKCCVCGIIRRASSRVLRLLTQLRMPGRRSIVLMAAGLCRSTAVARGRYALLLLTLPTIVINYILDSNAQLSAIFSIWCRHCACRRLQCGIASQTGALRLQIRRNVAIMLAYWPSPRSDVRLQHLHFLYARRRAVPAAYRHLAALPAAAVFAATRPLDRLQPRPSLMIAVLRSCRGR